MLYLSYEDYHNTFGGLLTAQQYAVFGARADAPCFTCPMRTTTTPSAAF